MRMKKKIQLATLVYALVSGVLYGQGQKNAQPVAKANVAEPAPAMTKGSDSTMQTGLIGGYSFLLSNSAPRGTTANGGGFYVGLDFLMGKALQYGLGVAYMQTSTLSGATTAILPITAKLRYFVMTSLYVGGNVGYAVYLSTLAPGNSVTTVPIGAELGYSFDLGGSAVDFGLQGTLNLVTDSAGSLSTSYNQLYLTPYFRLATKF